MTTVRDIGSNASETARNVGQQVATALVDTDLTPLVQIGIALLIGSFAFAMIGWISREIPILFIKARTDPGAAADYRSNVLLCLVVIGGLGLGAVAFLLGRMVSESVGLFCFVLFFCCTFGVFVWLGVRPQK